MIGLSLLSSVSKHNMWTINTIIIRPHIMFTDRGQQRQPNHDTTTYCVYWRKTTTTTQSSYDQVVVLWLGCRFLPSVNTICGRIMIGLSLSSVSKHNMWSYYDSVFVFFRPKKQHTGGNTTTYWVYWRTTKTINQIVIRPHIVLTDGRQRQPNHNTTTYCAYWRYDWVVVVFRQ
jgi:hypothetical protein